LPIVIDKTTYSQNLDDLPLRDQYVVNGDRSVSKLFGLEKTEAVMQQGIQASESRRTLTGDDVAILRLGMSGLDMLAGTSDDYTVLLQYVGITENANIVMVFDNETPFSACEVSAQYIGDNDSHIVLTQDIFHSIVIIHGFLIRNWLLQIHIFRKSHWSSMEHRI
jgi:hypothetical protein